MRIIFVQSVGENPVYEELSLSALGQLWLRKRTVAIWILITVRVAINRNRLRKMTLWSEQP